ncbi:hypothetical protein [Sulfurimonas aquatica]|uniref:hypothetical protein n=1 Tax=Sulfurimonas aquatica TaxID=2672570 RepID=UPI001A98574F|nr:hypothetical protein [Sulfurimonas aquatica]
METNSNLSTTVSQLLINLEAEALYSELKAEGYPLLISKKQYATISGCSLSTVDNQIKLGYGLPNYKKMGDAKNAKVMFSLISVANFFASKTIQTA